MLSLLLRPTHPNLRCLAFGVPGSVFSENLAEECSSWLTSFVLDADVIPRLAIHQFEVLRNSVLDMICRIKVSKYQVFSLEKSSTKSRDELAEERKRTMYDVDEIPDSECKCRLDDFLGFQAELKHKNETTEHYIDLFPPGKIIQFFRTRDPAGITLTRTAPGRDANNSQQNPTFYVARWIQRKDLRNIILSSHMLNDHVPGNMSRKIQKVAETIFDLKPPTYKVFQDIEA